MSGELGEITIEDGRFIYRSYKICLYGRYEGSMKM